MKKILAILFSIIVTISCNTREKIPSNIITAMDKVNNTKDRFIKFEMEIDNLSDDSIRNLSEMEINRLISEELIVWEKYLNAKSELNDILKYNAKFSDYREVKKSLEFSDSIVVFQSRYYKLVPKYEINFK